MLNTKFKRVENALDNNQLSVKSNVYGLTKNPTDVIFYKNVPLWATITALKNLDIFLYDGASTKDPYSLFCVDEWGDIYTYGMWNRKEDALEWLKDPYPLY